MREFRITQLTSTSTFRVEYFGRRWWWPFTRRWWPAQKYVFCYSGGCWEDAEFPSLPAAQEFRDSQEQQELVRWNRRHRRWEEVEG